MRASIGLADCSRWRIGLSDCAGVFRSWRRTGMFASWPTFGGGIGGSNEGGVRGGLEGILAENSDGGCDVDRRRRPIGFAGRRKAAHLEFDSAFVAAVGARRHALLEDFGGRRVMQRRPVPRGEWRRRSAACGARLGSRVGTTIGRDPCRPATPPRA